MGRTAAALGRLGEWPDLACKFQSDSSVVELIIGSVYKTPSMVIDIRMLNPKECFCLGIKQPPKTISVSLPIEVKNCTEYNIHGHSSTQFRVKNKL